jgi:uncharacterized protein (DUF4415 family)
MNGENSSNTSRQSRTDWERLARMTDDEIDTSDIPELGDEFFGNARLVLPEGKTTIILSLDEDVADWFEEQGPDYQQVINTALREYADAHR